MIIKYGCGDLQVDIASLLLKEAGCISTNRNIIIFLSTLNGNLKYDTFSPYNNILYEHEICYLGISFLYY